MAFDLVNPTRIEPGQEGHSVLLQQWNAAGGPRTFGYGGVLWMQITDTMGIVFVPKGREVAGDTSYGSVSFQH